MRLKKTIPLTYLFKETRLSLFYTLVILFCTGFAADRFKAILPALPAAVPLFFGAAALILSLVKLNRAYNSWQELRKIWETIANDSRSFMLYLQSYMGKEQKAVIKKIAFRHIAWCHSLSQFMRGEDADQNQGDFLPEEELDRIGKSSDKHQFILQLNSAHIADLTDQHKLSISGQIQLTNKIASFSGAANTAGSVKTSTVPAAFNFIMYLSVFLFIMTSFCSFSEIGGIFKMSLLLIFSAVFLLMEKITQYLKNPFGNLKTDPIMANISDVIENEIRNLMDQAEIVSPESPKLLYIL